MFRKIEYFPCCPLQIFHNFLENLRYSIFVLNRWEMVELTEKNLIQATFHIKLLNNRIRQISNIATNHTQSSSSYTVRYLYRNSPLSFLTYFLSKTNFESHEINSFNYFNSTDSQQIGFSRKTAGIITNLGAVRLINFSAIAHKLSKQINK